MLVKKAMDDGETPCFELVDAVSCELESSYNMHHELAASTANKDMLPCSQVTGEENLESAVVIREIQGDEPSDLIPPAVVDNVKTSVLIQDMVLGNKDDALHAVKEQRNLEHASRASFLYVAEPPELIWFKYINHYYYY